MSDRAGSSTLLVDASAFITLAEIGQVPALLGEKGDIAVPEPVANEITSGPAASTLSAALDSGSMETRDVGVATVETAADHLGRLLSESDLTGRGHAEIEGTSDCWRWHWHWHVNATTRCPTSTRRSSSRMTDHCVRLARHSPSRFPARPACWSGRSNGATSPRTMRKTSCLRWTRSEHGSAPRCCAAPSG